MIEIKLTQEQKEIIEMGDAFYPDDTQVFMRSPWFCKIDGKFYMLNQEETERTQLRIEKLFNKDVQSS